MTIRLIDKKTGEVTFDGQRVSRSLPCPICSHLHTRQGWCVVDPVRGLSICPRVESPQKIGEAGWLHGAQIAQGVHIQRLLVLERSAVDWHKIWQSARDQCKQSDINRLAESICVDPEAIKKIGVGIYEGSWAFAMRGGDNGVCGVKLRTPDGKKLCVKGSRLGLVVPESYDSALNTLWITEGESDLAVAVSWNLNALGRMGCRSSVQQIVDRSKGKEVVIIADRDEAGIAGATALVKSIGRMSRSVIVVQPNAKDLREWHLAGAVCEDLMFRVSSIRGW